LPSPPARNKAHAAEVCETDKDEIHMTTTAPFIDLAQNELEAYRRTGDALHLAHASRALNEALARIARAPTPREAANVGSAVESR
jgi:hypothetical protein